MTDGKKEGSGRTCLKCGVYTVCGVHPINGCFYGEPRAPTQKEGEEMRARISELEVDLAMAVGKGWNNGGTLVSFCSYCNEWRPEYDGGKPHSPTCLVTKYAASLPKDEP